MNQDIADALAAARAHFDAGQFDLAARLLDDILSIEPDHGEALEGRGYIAAKAGDYRRAADYLTRAIEHMPADPQQLYFAAHVCQLAQRHQDAVSLFERCLAGEPDHAPALHGAAISLVRLGDDTRALQLLARLASRYPQSPEVHYNRGTLLGALGRYDDELAAYRQAIALKPGFVRAHVNLGVALRDLHRFDEALQQFKKALSIDPNDAGARTNRAQTNLLLGEFGHGWREYEWRWRDGGQMPEFPAATLWTGAQPVAGKTVLVHHEQGFGDTLQFIRFVDRLDAAGARVVLRVQDALLPLLRNYPHAHDVLGDTAPVPPFDYHIPMLSLPFALNARESDFAVTPPYLHADSALAAQWNDLFSRADGRPVVGVAWSGSTTHVDDRNRSMRLETLAPLFEAPVSFVSLQKDVRESDRAYLAQLGERGVLVDVSSRLATFADTAALIERLDLVIAVDTAVAHLAAALGRPTWIALPFTPDWRWQLDRDDSSWYPTIRLFRQRQRGDWSGVVAALRQELDRL